MKIKKNNKKIISSKKKKSKRFLPPPFCDYFCKYAEFGSPDSVGACRKELSVFCKKYKKYNLKNSDCLFKKKN